MVGCVEKASLDEANARLDNLLTCMQWVMWINNKETKRQEALNVINKQYYARHAAASSREEKKRHTEEKKKPKEQQLNPRESFLPPVRSKNLWQTQNRTRILCKLAIAKRIGKKVACLYGTYSAALLVMRLPVLDTHSACQLSKHEFGELMTRLHRLVYLR